MEEQIKTLEAVIEAKNNEIAELEEDYNAAMSELSDLQVKQQGTLGVSLVIIAILVVLLLL